MATGGSGDPDSGQGHVLGFPLDIVVGGQVDAKFLCVLCERVLRNPMQSFCGHRFCRECITALLANKESEICPSCKKEDIEIEYSTLKIDQIFPDNAIKRDFTTVKVKCPNQGCPWTGNLKVYENDHEKSCEFLSVQCERCGQFVAVPKKANHDSDECPQRPVKCVHCDYKGPASTMQEHLDVECPKRPFDCQYCDVKAIPRSKLLQHYENVCSSKMVMCPVVRCYNVGPQDAVEKHKSENALVHIDAINVKLRQIEQEVIQLVSQKSQRPSGIGVTNNNAALTDVNKRIDQLSRQLQNVTLNSRAPSSQQPQETGGATGGAPGGGEVSDAVRALVEEQGRKQDQKIATFDAIAAVLNSEILKCLNRVDECMNTVNATNTQVTELVQKVHALEEDNREKGEILTRLQREQTNNTDTSYDGTFVWKVTQVGQRRQEGITGRNTSIYSPAFYTSRTGYKMCLRVYLNGDGMGRGSHLSIYFVVMKGPYDPLLKWPFRQKVTLMLLDQNRREHVIDAFRPDPSSNSFKLPTSEMNIASGCPLFTPLATLDSTAGNKAYIKDDVLFIKCVVDTSDLV